MGLTGVLALVIVYEYLVEALIFALAVTEGHHYSQLGTML